MQCSSCFETVDQQQEGWRQAGRQRTALARRLWREALAAKPGHQQSLLGLASLEARSGNHDKASTCPSPHRHHTYIHTHNPTINTNLA